MASSDGEFLAYGFTWGPVSVERTAVFEHSNGPYRVLRVVAPEVGRSVEIYISPTGRSMRVFRNGVELKEPVDLSD